MVEVAISNDGDVVVFGPPGKNSARYRTQCPEKGDPLKTNTPPTEPMEVLTGCKPKTMPSVRLGLYSPVDLHKVLKGLIGLVYPGSDGAGGRVYRAGQAVAGIISLNGIAIEDELPCRQWRKRTGRKVIET